MKNLFFTGFFLLFFSFIQAQKSNWQNLDLKKDGVFGISTEKAYNELLKDKNAQTIIVAVIDEGIDIEHEDLKPVIWTNPGEIPSNGIDDDHNGYVDDLHGWNFSGAETDSAMISHMTTKQKAFYDSLSYTGVPEAYLHGYQVYRKMLKDYDNQQQQAIGEVAEITAFKAVLDTIVNRLGKESPNVSDFNQLHAQNEDEKKVQGIMIRALKDDSDFTAFIKRQIDEPLNYFTAQSVDRFNSEDGPRPQIEAFYSKLDNVERWLNSINPYEPYASHGTHVAGIIAAVRNNGIGINGVADHAKLMALKAVTDRGDWEKAVASAIRYAADNGAKVINMSINLGYGDSGNKKIVGDAVKYAMEKDVLIVHAAGNDGKNIENVGRAYTGAWIEVGASGPADDSTLVAAFSNYGKTVVDVFAPGVHIYSSVIGSKYESYSGTSMAAPVVTGLAALIREYYPKLTAVQVKAIIMRSVVKPDHLVTIKVDGEFKKVWLSDICISGGIVNAYNALKLAATY